VGQRGTGGGVGLPGVLSVGGEAKGGRDHGVVSVSKQLADGVDVPRVIRHGLGTVQGWRTRGGRVWWRPTEEGG